MSAPTLKQLFDRYEGQEPDTFYIECVLYHGQKMALANFRRMMNEAGMLTSRLDAMLDEYESYVDADMANTCGG